MTAKKQTHMNLSDDHRRRIQGIRKLCVEHMLESNKAAVEYAIDFTFEALLPCGNSEIDKIKRQRSGEYGPSKE